MKYAYPPKPHRMSKKPTIFQSLIPILTLIGLIGLSGVVMKLTRDYFGEKM